MNEMLFQFIWQYSLYNPVDLKTTSGEPLTVIHPGTRNTNAGPDFEEARIRIGNTVLIGNVELHVRTSDWERHGHDSDRSYHNIILHVVYQDDRPDEAVNFPKLQLWQQIPAYVVDQYTNLLQPNQSIACARNLPQVRSIIRESWLSRLLAERWEQKLADWNLLLSQSAGDWRNLLYWRLAANFGFRINSEPFLSLSRSVPLNILARHRLQLQALESLLFGQAGLLNQDFKDVYPQELKKEYCYLASKYRLKPIDGHHWKYLRMRPSNFPTIRIAQFAALIHQSLHLFSKLIVSASVKEIHPLFQVQASSYWDTHFRFDEPQQKPGAKHLGADSINNIIINTIAPIRFLYAHHHARHKDAEKALELLNAVPPEQNKFISLWGKNNWKAYTAADTQALLQLYHRYCTPKRCLECPIGLNIIKEKPAR